jgi:hypothetical protein
MCCRSRSIASAEWIAAFELSVPQLVKMIARLAAEQRRDSLAREFQRIVHPFAEAVSARRIAVIPREPRQHFRDDGRVHAGGRIVVEVGEVAGGAHLENGRRT